MKKHFLFLSMAGLCALLCSSCDKLETAAPSQTCTVAGNYNEQHPLAEQLQTIMQRYTKAGIPGMSIAIKTNAGFWTGAAGYAALEKQEFLQPCHLQYAQSITKTYMAALALKLAEIGQLQLDEPIAQHLPAHLKAMLPATDKITPRMLLQHTSGLKDYASELNYISFFLNNPVYDFKPEDYLAYIKGKKTNFAPGSAFEYSNTNALVLALVLNHLDSRGHARLLDELILKPNNLQQTFYKQTPDYLNTPQLVNSYWDRFSNGKLENVTLQQRKNVATLNGDDGLVATPLDFVNFMDKLVNGNMLSEQMKRQMQQWYVTEQGEQKSGLGLLTETFQGKFAFGHGGAGLGAGSTLYFFPHNGTILFLSVNIGTLTGSPAGDKAEEAQEEILQLLVQ